MKELFVGGFAFLPAPTSKHPLVKAAARHGEDSRAA